MERHITHFMYSIRHHLRSQPTPLCLAMERFMFNIQYRCYYWHYGLYFANLSCNLFIIFYILCLWLLGRLQDMPCPEMQRKYLLCHFFRFDSRFPCVVDCIGLFSVARIGTECAHMFPTISLALLPPKHIHYARPTVVVFFSTLIYLPVPLSSFSPHSPHYRIPQRTAPTLEKSNDFP